ncbi:MAG: metallophosphoesterase family protein [Candidatus Methanoperedens sp.]|nr:metallophosphoesterase family protein [Candidatus Methanoperedens sp.]
MKLLALSDFHGDYSHIGSILNMAGQIDAVLIAGDLTDFGPDENAFNLLEMFKVPVLAVPGNCDNPSLLKVLDKNENTINLHNSLHRMEGLTFIGLGGSNPTPFNTPFELTEKKIGEYIGTLLSGSKGRMILLSHPPPLNTMDKLPHGNVGSAALARYLGRFDLIVCGHIHEARGMVNVNGTIVVNPGMASKGQGAIITINETINVEFIEA